MDRKEAYAKCMKASLRNAAMWLREARLIEKHGSKCHAQALTIFANEEVGKAFMCWSVVAGVVPYNHPDVDIGKSSSVFRKHSLKSSVPAGGCYSWHYFTYYHVHWFSFTSHRMVPMPIEILS